MLLLYSLQREKCHAPRGFLLPPLFPPRLRAAVNETVCWSQTSTTRPCFAAAQGPGPQERACRALWHLWHKHVACWCAKNLVGGLYLFFKELVKSIYTRHCLHARALKEKRCILCLLQPARRKICPRGSKHNLQKRCLCSSVRSPKPPPSLVHEKHCPRLQAV